MLEGHTKRVGIVSWHPTARNVLLSAGLHRGAPGPALTTPSPSPLTRGKAEGPTEALNAGSGPQRVVRADSAPPGRLRQHGAHLERGHAEELYQLDSLHPDSSPHRSAGTAMAASLLHRVQGQERARLLHPRRGPWWCMRPPEGEDNRGLAKGLSGCTAQISPSVSAGAGEGSRGSPAHEGHLPGRRQGAFTTGFSRMSETGSWAPGGSSEWLCRPEGRTRTAPPWASRAEVTQRGLSLPGCQLGP